MFSEPKVGTTSGIMFPVMRRSRPCTTAKHGGRMRTRYGVPLPSDERVAGLVLPRGLTKIEALSSERRHVYSSEVPRDRLLRYFGPRLTTMNVEQDGEVVTYHEAIPREARGGIVKLDVTIRSTSAHPARVDIYERPPPSRGASISEEEIRRHLSSQTKNRE